MEKLNTFELSNVLKDVRNSYRVLALYQQRILDTVKYIGNQYNWTFHSGWAKFSSASLNGKIPTTIMNKITPVENMSICFPL